MCEPLPEHVSKCKALKVQRFGLLMHGVRRKALGVFRKDSFPRPIYPGFRAKTSQIQVENPQCGVASGLRPCIVDGSTSCHHLACIFSNSLHLIYICADTSFYIRGHEAILANPLSSTSAHSICLSRPTRPLWSEHA